MAVTTDQIAFRDLLFHAVKRVEHSCGRTDFKQLVLCIPVMEVEADRRKAASTILAWPLLCSVDELLDLCALPLSPVSPQVPVSAIPIPLVGALMVEILVAHLVNSVPHDADGRSGEATHTQPFANSPRAQWAHRTLRTVGVTCFGKIRSVGLFDAADGNPPLGFRVEAACHLFRPWEQAPAAGLEPALRD